MSHLSHPIFEWDSWDKWDKNKILSLILVTSTMDIIKISTTVWAAIFSLFTPQQQNDIPQYDHVVVVIEENHAYHELIGSANAPYINQLAKGGVLFSNSHGIGHPSQPNYLALFSGSTQGVTGDECLEGKTPFKTPNLGEA
jgi:acid phosphatase